MKINIIIVIVFTLFACQKNRKNRKLDIKKHHETIVVASKLDISNDFFISLYSFIQANNSGLYITPSNTINDSVLYKYPYKKLGKCCVKLEGVLREGRGPKELLKVRLSAKTVSNDTLLFYSFNASKYISIDNKGKISESFKETPKIVNTGYAFAYNKGHLLIPTFSKFTGRDHLFTMINLKTNSIQEIFQPRVPAGYEPAIRNQVFTMGTLPDGFAISFIGDRKLYIIGFNGEIKKELIFGKSEPIPEPYKITNPKQAPSSKPYLTKIEFYKGNILVLVDNIIWIIDYPSYETKTLLKILKDPKDKSAPVIDFSITNETIYIRMGRSGLYFVKISPNWF